MVSIPTIGRSAGRRIATIAVVSLALLVAGSLLLALRYDLYKVQTAVMDPAAGRGQQVLVASQTNDTQLRAGDVVVVASGGWADEPPGVDYILRVAAIGGDTISCCTDAGKVTVNGAVKQPATVTGDAPGAPTFSAKVPDGRVFLLGDRRDIARDSRAHLRLEGGTVPLSAVKGRVVAKLVPPGTVPGIDPASGVSVNPLDPGGAYLYAAVLALMGAIGLVYALVQALKARPRRRGDAALSAATLG